MSVPYCTVPGKIQYRIIGSVSEFTEDCRRFTDRCGFLAIVDNPNSLDQKYFNKNNNPYLCLRDALYYVF